VQLVEDLTFESGSITSEGPCGPAG
jgi:hypothetical protein